jgi:hypothetical protein
MQALATVASRLPAGFIQPFYLNSRTPAPSSDANALAGKSESFVAAISLIEKILMRRGCNI